MQMRYLMNEMFHAGRVSANKASNAGIVFQILSITYLQIKIKIITSRATVFAETLLMNYTWAAFYESHVLGTFWSTGRLNSLSEREQEPSFISATISISLMRRQYCIITACNVLCDNRRWGHVLSDFIDEGSVEPVRIVPSKSFMVVKHKRNILVPW